MKELMERKKIVDGLRAEVEKYTLIGLKTGQGMEKARHLDGLAEEMLSRIGELEDLGVSVRDIDLGLVDFPAERYGVKVFLCWRYGETDVAFWHRPEEGFGGRKPLKSPLISP